MCYVILEHPLSWVNNWGRVIDCFNKLLFVRTQITIGIQYYVMGIQTGSFGIQTDAVGIQTDAVGIQTDAVGMQTDAVGI